MNKYSIKTNGTSQFEAEGSRFYFQDGFMWFVDGAGNCLYAIDAKQVSSVEMVK